MDIDADTPDGRRYYQTNGWTFWEYADASGTQRPMEALRKQYLNERSRNARRARARADLPGVGRFVERSGI
jgi:hypothetical protein